MIRAAELRVVDETGEQLGVMSSDTAIELAEGKGLDLVEISPNAEPPVCRIMDFGKHKYLMSKKAHEAKKKQTVIHIKEVKLRVKTDEHDLLFKIRNARKFLDNGDKVKVTLSFRGREITHPELGLASLKRVIEDLKDVGTVEVYPKREGRNLMMLLTPIITKEAKKLQEKKDAKDKNK